MLGSVAGRREYALSPSGRRRLERDLAAWRELTESLETMAGRQERTATRG